MLATLTLSALLVHGSAHARPIEHHREAVRPVRIAVDLHPMTDEERSLFPGRERFDKTEWYESQLKSVKSVVTPEHVDDWDNGGRDCADQLRTKRGTSS